jgi:hypothetical protein
LQNIDKSFEFIYQHYETYERDELYERDKSAEKEVLRVTLSNNMYYASTD